MLNLSNMLKKYPDKLNPYQVLEIDPSIGLQMVKQNFKMKMHNNEYPAFRLAYEMIVNQDDYDIDYTTSIFSVRNKGIFYYAHVGGLDEIKYFIQHNPMCLNQKDKLGRTILYIAARNGYYSLCKYLLDQGANINDYQNHGNTPIQSASFYGHDNIVKLIKEYQKKQLMKSANYGINNFFNINNQIPNFDEILKNTSDEHYLHHSNFFNFIKTAQANYPIYNNIPIFSKEKYNNIKKNFYYKYNNNLFTTLENRCIGCIIGLAIGDAIGARVEFQPLDYNYKGVRDMGYQPAGKFNLKPGQWTDDTSMGLCLADSLIENNGNFEGHDLMIRFILWWFYGYNNAFRFDNERPRKNSIGLGGNIAASLKKYIEDSGKDMFTDSGNDNTSGNGSIIRNAAIPICFYQNMNLALQMAQKQSKVTHQGNEAAGCCQLLTYIIILLLNGKNLHDTLNNLEKGFCCQCDSVNSLAYSKIENNDPNRDWRWNQTTYTYSLQRANANPGYIGSYAMDAMAMALHILVNTSNFEDAILKGVNLRGDADSVGAVIGQIAGAYYGLDGIPKEWFNKILEWDRNNEIALRGYILCHLGKNEQF